jgi:hypothetical protein
MAAPAPHRPLSIRLINGVGATLRKLGLPLLELDEAGLLRAARRSTRLEDFGGEEFRTGLSRLLESIDSEAHLNVIGRIMTRAMLLNCLTNRLQLHDHRRRHPRVEEQEIRRPLFIVGLPRTGTTILFNLLAEDPQSRAPLTWEVQWPCPPPRSETFHTDPRIAKMAKQLSFLPKIAPNLRAIHEFASELPQECVAITGHELASVQFHVIMNVPSYQAWLDRQSFLLAYRFHRRFLQHLQSEHGGVRWVLKSPGHLAAIEDILAVYPDACIVHTHRDPVDVRPSLASLSYTLRGMSSDVIDPHEVGRQHAELWSRHLERAMRARERLRDRRSQFFDVYYEDVLRDPVAAVERIYEHFEIPLSEEARRRMNSYQVRKPRGEFGVHHYSLDEFGLDRETEAARFAEYRDRFAPRASAA